MPSAEPDHAAFRQDARDDVIPGIWPLRAVPRDRADIVSGPKVVMRYWASSQAVLISGDAPSEEAWPLPEVFGGFQRSRRNAALTNLKIARVDRG